MYVPSVRNADSGFEYTNHDAEWSWEIICKPVQVTSWGIRAPRPLSPEGLFGMLHYCQIN